MSTESSTTQSTANATSDSLQSKGHAARGKRYSPAQRREILDYAKRHRVCEAAERSSRSPRPPFMSGAGR